MPAEGVGEGRRAHFDKENRFVNRERQKRMGREVPWQIKKEWRTHLDVASVNGGRGESNPC